MGDEALDAIAGAISAQKFILENIYALIIAQDSDPIATCRRTASEMLRQFEDLAPTNLDEIAGEEVFRITQHGVDHLERFWRQVEGRLRSRPA